MSPEATSVCEKPALSQKLFSRGSFKKAGLNPLGKISPCEKIVPVAPSKNFSRTSKSLKKPFWKLASFSHPKSHGHFQFKRKWPILPPLQFCAKHSLWENQLKKDSLENYLKKKARFNFFNKISQKLYPALILFLSCKNLHRRFSFSFTCFKSSVIVIKCKKIKKLLCNLILGMV